MSNRMYFKDVDDKKAAVFSQQLAATESSDVTELDLVLSQRLTERGAQVLAHGLQQSQIKTLNISCQYRVETNGRILQPLFVVAFQRDYELHLDFYLNDSAVNVLSEILLSLDVDDDDDDGNYHSLQALSLQIGANRMTMEGAHQFAIALRHATLKSLDLRVYPSMNVEIMTMIVVAALDGARELLLSGHPVDDDLAIRIGDALVGNTTLRSFNLYVKHDLSLDTAVRLANGISHSNIVDLTLNLYESNDELPADVVDAFYKGVARSPTIRHLTLGKKFCATPGLAQCLTRLHTFGMMHSLAVEEVPTLMTCLRNATDLSSLTLHGGFPLAFDKQPNEGNDDNNDESCDLESRRIQATTTEQLMLAVADHPLLDKLTLWHCSDVGFAGLAMIGMHLPNITKLSELRLCFFRDKYSPSDKRESVKQAFQRACQALVDGVKANWNLRVLRLPRHFPSTITDKINFYLDLNKSGRYMLHETDIEKVPTGLWCRVLAKCGNKAGRSNRAGLLYYYLREQPTLAASGM